MKTLRILQILTLFTICLFTASTVKAKDDDRGKFHQHHEFWNHDIEEHNFHRDHFYNNRPFEFPWGDPTKRAPIDGGLSILLAAGIGFGIKRVAKRKNAKSAV